MPEPNVASVSRILRRRGGKRIRSALVLCVVFAAAASLLAGGPADSGEDRLTVGLLSEPPTLNPLVVVSGETMDIVWQLYLKLLDEQPDYLNFRPRLAERYEFSEDSLSITFFLRDDVYWTDGEPVTAHDVRFTWELQVDTTVAWPSSSIKQHVSGVEVVDRLTAVFHFARRYPNQLMDANDGVILPKHLLEGVPRGELRTHAIGRNPVGNGPFKLGRWEPGQYMELVRNPGYFEKGKPYVERVIFKFVPDMVTLVTQLKKGEIDLLESIPPDDLPGLTAANPRLKIYTYPSRDYHYIAWNVGNELFSSPEVRRALTMAIDREEIIKTLYGGRAVQCKSPIHASLWAYDETIEAIPYDPTASRGALEDMGWRDTDGDGVLDKNGKPFEFELVTNHSAQLRVDIATMVEAYLKKIGVRANIRTLEFGTVVDKLLSSEFESCVFGWGTATKPDITNHWHSSAVPRSGLNISCYRNPEVDDLIDRAKVELDRNEARSLWSKVQRIIYEEQPFTFIAIPYEVNALDGRFCNVQPNAISFFYNLRDWRSGPACE